MPNIYLGRDSCTARRDGVYVQARRRRGIDTLAEAAGIAALILAELRRGYTYNHRCRRIRMTRRLARQRLYFLLLLAERHGAAGSGRRRIRELVEYVVENWRLPPWARGEAKKAIKRVER